MSIVEQLQLLREGPLAIVFVLLFTVLTLLTFTYFLLWLKKRKHDRLAFQHNHYYHQALALLENDYTMVSPHPSSGLFGRETTITPQETTEYKQLIIPPPNRAISHAISRFQAYYEALQHHSSPNLSSLSCPQFASPWVLIQGGLFQEDGRRHPTLAECLMDNLLSPAEAEDFLLALASTLEKLHRLKTADGSTLYHGLLLPHYIFLVKASPQAPTRPLLANHGLAFSIPLLDHPEKDLDPQHLHLFTEYLPFLAPEVQEHNLTPASDYYSFAALACSLLTKERFTSSEKVSWDNVPSLWRPFLQQALHKDAQQRPSSFYQLLDRLSSPELQLVAPVQTTTSVETLATPQQKTSHKPLDLTEIDTLFRKKQWEQAYQLLQNSSSYSQEHPQVCVKQAIACYELGKTEEAHQLYKKTKELDALTAKEYRKHLTHQK